MSLFIMDTSFKKEFDLSCELSSPHYFKSSFARSMAVDSIHETKSLDNAFLDRESEQDYSSIQSEALWPPLVVTGSKNRSVKSAVVALNRGSKVQNDMDIPKLTRSNRVRTRTNDAVKLWKVKQEMVMSTDTKRQQSANPRNDYLDTLLMCKEYQSMDNSRRLQASDESRRTNDRRLHSIDMTVLQNKVDTLQWQLNQAEASRQMYHAVMKQVVRFLDRVYKNLGIIKTKIDPGGMPKLSYNRVPRSRSVHTVDASLSRASPVPESSASNFSRAKSIAQIEESQNYSTFRDFTWRRPRQECIDPDEIPIEKLSQEAFRLLRTAQSLLNTREPDLAQRLYSDNDSGGSSSHRSSVASHDEGLEQLSRKPDLMGSYSSLIQQSLDTASLPSAAYSNNSLTSGLESAFAGGCRDSSLGHSRKCKAPAPPLPLPSSPNTNSSPSVPQHSSVSSTEDESGFSSMSSFQEVGLPLISSSPTPKQGVSQRFQELTSKSYTFPDSSPIPKPQTTKPEHSHYRLYDLLESPSKDRKCESLPFKLTESLLSESQASKVEESSQRLQDTKSEDLSYRFQELGLPVVNKAQTTHRRWSSSPAETLQYSRHSASFCATAETLKVLWV